MKPKGGIIKAKYDNDPEYAKKQAKERHEKAIKYYEKKKEIIGE